MVFIFTNQETDFASGENCSSMVQEKQAFLARIRIEDLLVKNDHSGAFGQKGEFCPFLTKLYRGRPGRVGTQKSVILGSRPDPRPGRQPIPPGSETELRPRPPREPDLGKRTVVDGGFSSGGLHSTLGDKKEQRSGARHDGNCRENVVDQADRADSDPGSRPIQC